MRTRILFLAAVALLTGPAFASERSIPAVTVRVGQGQSITIPVAQRKVEVDAPYALTGVREAALETSFRAIRVGQGGWVWVNVR